MIGQSIVTVASFIITVGVVVKTLMWLVQQIIDAVPKLRERIRGCPDNKYRMKFVGWKDGKLIKTAPSGYKQGEIQCNFLEDANLPYWELV